MPTFKFYQNEKAVSYGSVYYLRLGLKMCVRRYPLYTCSIIYKYLTFNTPDENDERSRRETVEEQSRRMQIAIQVVYNLCVKTIFRNI